MTAGSSSCSRSPASSPSRSDPTRTIAPSRSGSRSTFRRGLRSSTSSRTRRSRSERVSTSMRTAKSRRRTSRIGSKSPRCARAIRSATPDVMLILRVTGMLAAEPHQRAHPDLLRTLPTRTGSSQAETAALGLSRPLFLTTSSAPGTADKRVCANSPAAPSSSSVGFPLRLAVLDGWAAAPSPAKSQRYDGSGSSFEAAVHGV